MKEILASLLLACGLACSAQVTNTNSLGIVSGPAADLISFLTTASNIMVAPYGIASTAGDLGGGVALAYKASDLLVPTLRLDYLNKHGLFMPSANLTLQAPLTIAGKFTTIPFAFSGLAVPLAGREALNGGPVGIFGAGLAFRLSSKWDLVVDDELWTGFRGQQIRFGVIYKF